MARQKASIELELGEKPILSLKRSRVFIDEKEKGNGVYLTDRRLIIAKRIAGILASRTVIVDAIPINSITKVSEVSKGVLVRVNYLVVNFKTKIREGNVRFIVPDEHTRYQWKRAMETEAPELEEEIQREGIPEKPELDHLIREIKRFRPIKEPQREKDLEISLISYLQAIYHDQVRTQLAYERTKIDAQIGKIGIEVKLQPDEGEFDRLYGQTEKYLKHLDHVVVVIGRERSEESTREFKKRLKERNWLDARVSVIVL